MPKCRPIPKALTMAETEMSADTDTEISAETDTETDNFRSLVMTGYADIEIRMDTI
jgi:hypothetical protein